MLLCFAGVAEKQVERSVFRRRVMLRMTVSSDLWRRM